MCGVAQFQDRSVNNSRAERYAFLCTYYAPHGHVSPHRSIAILAVAINSAFLMYPLPYFSSHMIALSFIFCFNITIDLIATPF